MANANPFPSSTNRETLMPYPIRAATGYVPARRAVEVALNVTDNVQGYTPAEQVAGVFFLAYLMAQQLGLDASQLFDASRRRYDFADTYFQREAQALSDYINGELR